MAYWELAGNESADVFYAYVTVWGKDVNLTEDMRGWPAPEVRAFYVALGNTENEQHYSPAQWETAWEFNISTSEGSLYYSRQNFFIYLNLSDRLVA